MRYLLLSAALLAWGAPLRAAAGDWAEGARAFVLALEAAGPRAAAPVSAVRGADGTLALAGAACPVLERQAAALSEWKTRLGEPAGPPGTCRCDGRGCSLPIASVSPEFVKSHHGLRARRWGPNCWNAALVSTGILARPRFTSPAEATFWLESPLCRPLRPGEAPAPGDVVAIRDRSGEEVHGFVYLSAELAFSKNLLTAAEPYALQSPAAVYAAFPVPEECRGPGAAAHGCPARSDHFRCRSWEDYARSSGVSLPPEYREAEAIVSEAERAVSFLAFGWKPDAGFRGGAELILASSRDALLPVRELARGRSGLAWSALSLRIDAILHQIELI